MENITVANYLGSVILNFIDNRFKLNEIIDQEKKGELEKIVLNMVIKPDSRQEIELGFKQELMCLLNEDEFYKNKFQESAIKISNQVVKLEEAKKYNNLPEIVIAEFSDKSIKEFVDEIIKVLHDVENLNNIQDSIVSYLLGYLFVNLSGESALGYEIKIDNRAVAQLRILGVIFLSFAVMQGRGYLSNSTQKFLGVMIHDLVLSSSTCSNFCAVQLYDNHEIGYEIKKVLGAKLDLNVLEKINRSALKKKINNLQLNSIQSQSTQGTVSASNYLSDNFLKTDLGSLVKLSSVINLFKAIQELYNSQFSKNSDKSLPNI